MPVVSYRMGPHPELLLCHAVVDTPTFAERVAAASSAGVQALGLDMTRRRRHHQLGETDESMRRDAAAAGVRVDELWSLYGVLDHTAAARTLAYADRLIEVAASFGALMIGAPADFDGDLVAASTLLAEVADRAARAGVRVGLEPVAFTRLDDVAVAATIVEACGRDNVGLVLDVWHLCRGRTQLQTIDDLSVAVEVVQLNDGTVAPSDPDPMVEVGRYRSLPGEGELDAAGVVRAVARNRPEVRWSAEVGTDELAALSPTEAAQRVATACRQFLTEVVGLDG
jgi:sugar phosphate isomerase/epimerase